MVHAYGFDRLRARAKIVTGVHKWQMRTGRVQVISCICIHGMHMKLVNVVYVTCEKNSGECCAYEEEVQLLRMGVCLKFQPVLRFCTAGVLV